MLTFSNFTFGRFLFLSLSLYSWRDFLTNHELHAYKRLLRIRVDQVIADC